MTLQTSIRAGNLAAAIDPLCSGADANRYGSEGSMPPDDCLRPRSPQVADIPFCAEEAGGQAPQRAAS